MLWLAVKAECFLQIIRDGFRGTAFDPFSVQHEHQLAVSHQGDTGRRRGLWGEILPGTFSGLNILTREYTGENVWFRSGLQGIGYRRPCIGSSAATY
jgi:hypothetical protein